MLGYSILNHRVAQSNTEFFCFLLTFFLLAQTSGLYASETKIKELRVYSVVKFIIY